MLQTGHPVDGSLNVNTKHVVVQLVQSEGEISVQLRYKVIINCPQSVSSQVYLLYEDGIDFIAANLQGISLQFEVDRGVVVPHIGHVLYAGDLLSHHVGVLHGNQRHAESHQLVDIIGPGSCGHRLFRFLVLTGWD